MCNLKNLIWAPLRANRCREMPRGRRVIVCGARPQFGTDYVQNALYKTLDPTPFSSIERYLSALGVRHAVGPYPVLLRSAPILGYVPLLPVWHGLAGRAADGEGCARTVLDGG
jgi:hypothetical protein